MREPINGVLGMARLLKDTPLDAEQSGYVGAIVESAEALVTLVNDVLDLSRIDAGRLKLVPVDMALPAFLERLRATLAPRAAQKGIGLRLEILPGVPELVRADPARLRQVLVNLLGNALKFTEAGEVRLTVGPDAPFRDTLPLVLAVHDTGIGIDEATRARLFAPFVQAGPATGRLYGGSGLGLLIARRIVEAMGGTLECTSRPGEGTTFTARLRLARPTSAGTGSQDAAMGLAGLSLLVVDEQERTRLGTRDLAGMWGMDVRAARTGPEALALMFEAADRGSPFDIVIVDAALAEPGAIELARRVRAEPKLAPVRLVLLASSGLRGDAAAARAAGFQAYLPKPTAAATLVDCLRRLRTASADVFVTIHSLSEQRGRPLAVLVVDDNPVNCRLASILLERAGHDVTVAGGGAAALQLLAERPFDLVLMDIQMPGMDGLEATRRIRALPDPSRAKVPIVALTANALNGEDERCRAAGMDFYLTKPIDGASLVGAVERLGRPAAGAQPPGSG